MDTNRKQQLQKLAKDVRRAYDLAGEGNLAEAAARGSAPSPFAVPGVAQG